MLRRRCSSSTLTRKYITKAQYDQLNELSDEVSRLLTYGVLSRSLRKQNIQKAAYYYLTT